MFLLKFKENNEIFVRRFESEMYLNVLVNKTKHISIN